jgi:hypothetical protein
MESTMKLNRTITWLATGLLFAASSFVTGADAPTTAPTYDLDEVIPLVPTEYRHKLVQTLSQAEDNEPAMLAAIHDAKPEQREAVAYLLLNMPEHDLKTMKEKYLLDNVELAYKAREATEFGKAVPKELFFQYVLPYANTDETREDWRKAYYDQFMPLVKDAKTTGEAAQILNKQVFPLVQVKYNATKRKQPIQSPFESASIHYASCTGLTIILADACRACGVPARMVGTPMWFDNSGNHTWTEVWDNQWHYVGSAEPSKKLDNAWFTDNAAKADPKSPEHRIYAVSFQHTDLPWFLVLNEDAGVSAIDVTASYIGKGTLTVKATGGTVEVRQKGNLVGQSKAADATFSLAAGVDFKVMHLDDAGKEVSTGETKLEKDKPTALELK